MHLETPQCTRQRIVELHLGDRLNPTARPVDHPATTTSDLRNRVTPCPWLRRFRTFAQPLRGSGARKR